jgi:hypothetical protein
MAWCRAGGSGRRLEKTTYMELHNLYASLNIIRTIKSRRMGWTRHVACMGDMRNVYKILFGKRKRQLGRPRRRWKVILECILGKCGGKMWT